MGRPSSSWRYCCTRSWRGESASGISCATVSAGETPMWKQEIREKKHFNVAQNSVLSEDKQILHHLRRKIIKNKLSWELVFLVYFHKLPTTPDVSKQLLLGSLSYPQNNTTRSALAVRERQRGNLVTDGTSHCPKHTIGHVSKSLTFEQYWKPPWD